MGVETISGNVGNVVFYGKDTQTTQDDMIYAEVGNSIAKFYNKAYSGSDDVLYKLNANYPSCKIWNEFSEVLSKLKIGDYVTLDGHLLEKGVHGVTEILKNVPENGTLCCAVIGGLTALALGVYLLNR